MLYSMIPEKLVDGEWFESWEDEADKWAVWSILDGQLDRLFGRFDTEAEAEDFLESIL